MTTVMTAMWGTAYERYGRKFLETFDAYWPRMVDLVVTTHGPIVMPPHRLTHTIDLHGIREIGAFYERHPPLNDGPQNWRHDARKWAPQAIIPVEMIRGLPDGEVVAWFDADVETFARVPEGFLEALFHNGDDVLHLGRDSTHSELGFYALILNRSTRQLLTDFRALYMTDKIFDLPEQHSAYAFDVALRAFVAKGGRARSLTTGRGHVWWQTPLGLYTDHQKGKRKDIGMSKESRGQREAARKRGET